VTGVDDGDQPEPGVAKDVTLLEVLAAFAADGFTDDFLVDDDGWLCCRVCGTCVPPDRAAVEGTRRVEGASDPADMAAVLACRCDACGSRGTVIVRFGPEAEPEHAALLTHLDAEPGR
jgi:hypothetical protein